MKDLQVFNFQESEIRTFNINNAIWFVLKDLCETLEIKNHNDVVKRLNAHGVDSTDLIDSLGRKQNATIVNEGNMYKVIFQSRKEEAEEFQDWISEEVLPSIRKNGAYMTDAKIEEVLTNPDTIIQLATQLKEERANKMRLEEKISRDAPLTNFGRAIVNTEDAVCIGTFAKLLQNNDSIKLGRNKLFEWLRQQGYLKSRGEEC